VVFVMMLIFTTMSFVHRFSFCFSLIIYHIHVA
jgi:hypothetical protein